MQKIRETLNDAQIEAVGIDRGPALIVAGAGTGKTRVVVERVVRLLSDGVSGKRILALTFTEKAAAEMLDRVNLELGSYQLELPIMTFNAYGESLLRRYGADIGLGRNFTLLGDSARIVFLRERLDQLKLDYFAPISRPFGQLSDVADYFSHLKQNVITPADYAKYASKLPATDEAEKLDKKKHLELATAYGAYIDLCREANVIDYDDQLYLLIDLFKQRPNVLKEVQSGYDFVMVDEFQDTNAMQSVLVDMIAGSNQNLFVVGDDDQSIYGWRGATLANILDFKDRYPKAREITLVQNYRSSREILDTAYRLIQHNNPHRLEERLKINKRLISDREGLKPSVCQFKTLDEELQWIAEDIKRRIDDGTSPGSIAVLARRNHTVELLHSQLDYLDVEHVVIGQRYELYREPVVRMILEAVKAVADPTDSTSLYHTLTGGIFTVPPGPLGKLAGNARRHHESLQESIMASTDDDLEEARNAMGLIEQWREKISTVSVGQLTYEMLKTSGFTDRIFALGELEGNVLAPKLNELFKTMKEFEQIALQPSAIEYVESLPALQAAGDSTSEDGTLDLSGQSVNVLTIHKSKGLEWPIVYIADCTEGSFPLRETSRGIVLPEDLLVHRPSEADNHMSEERRLMYVAMTRARNELILTHAERHSGASTRKPSRFLAEAFDDPDFAPIRHEITPNNHRLSAFGVPSPAAVPIPSRILDGQKVTLSVSQIDAYQRCPLDFYYCYVLNVPKQPSPSQDYGSLMHSLIEDINRSLMSGQLLPMGQLEKRLKQEWPRGGYVSKNHRERALGQGQATLKRLYENAKNQPRVPLSIEQPFNFNLPDYNLTVNGRFDAVFPLGDGIEIVDYKTSSTVTTAEKAKQRAGGSSQLTHYAMAWQILHDELPALVTLDFIDTGVQGSLKKTQRGIDNANLRLGQVADGIRAHDFSPGKDHKFCNHPLE